MIKMLPFILFLASILCVFLAYRAGFEAGNRYVQREDHGVFIHLQQLEGAEH